MGSPLYAKQMSMTSIAFGTGSPTVQSDRLLSVGNVIEMMASRTDSAEIAARKGGSQNLAAVR